MTAFRCAAASLDRTESLVGTASTVRAFLLVEAPGAWGVDAVAGARLPDDVRAHLRWLGRDHGVRVLLIRDHVRRRPSTVRVFAAYVGARGPFVETAELPSLDAVRHLRVEGLAAGERPGLTPYEGQLFLVCTHGRHDACCAEQGRPLARALHAVAPEATWEVSHVGGDRFAPNVVVLPTGLYYGRLDPADAAAFVDTHRSGRLSLPHLRGRCAFPFRVQAAEAFLREHTGDTSLAAPRVLRAVRDGDLTRVAFELAGEPWDVVVRTDHVAPQQLTCRAANPSGALAHTLEHVGRWTAPDQL
ncbi:sucrase ferredoxin [Nocardioides iriomotensis]|uniref:sucrase ferredoxin n=1 Tax=Nocardioides iriomotensis TaxID=715784 RepID=UPI0013EB477A|nr:sucrase ferredoxin [Nocardioides iriomotensis]